jgi:nicotinate-nucleotide adenylyltransferase
MKIGLFFGSFNPVHTGHLIIANYMAFHTDLEQVWLVVSPHNPLKSKATLANDYDRLHLVQLAIENNPRLRASNIEFSLPKPSYTIDTLTYLKEKHPEHQFVLIMGGDNLMGLTKWKNYELILRDYWIYVFKRPHYLADAQTTYPHVRVFEDTPLMEISATFVRRCVQEGKSIRYLVPDAVMREILDSNLYR